MISYYANPNELAKRPDNRNDVHRRGNCIVRLRDEVCVLCARVWGVVLEGMLSE